MFLIFRRIGGVEFVEADLKSAKVSLMPVVEFPHKFLRSHSFLGGVYFNWSS